MRRLIVFLLFFLSGVTFSYACNYTSQIEECNSALASSLNIENGNTTIIPGASLREIEDFVCLQDSPERRVYQIVLDMKFRVIDEEMDNYLSSVKSSTDYFGAEATKDYMDAILDFGNASDYFKDKYKNACKEVLPETMECIMGNNYTIEGETGNASILEASNFIIGVNGDCDNLIKIKLDIFNQVSYNMLLLNKQQVARNDKKLYDQDIRTKYNRLVDLMMINRGYLERIWKKWPEKIKNTLGT